jgi:hypothetical protein
MIAVGIVTGGTGGFVVYIATRGLNGAGFAELRILYEMVAIGVIVGMIIGALSGWVIGYKLSRKAKKNERKR